MSDADLAASIPTEAAAVSAVGMFPVGLAETYHLLVLADDVTVEEVAAESGLPEPLWLETTVEDPGAGQVAVALTSGHVDKVRLLPEDPPAQPEALETIAEADFVVIGPGSWFTSIIPHLLVPELHRALCETRAKRVLSLNLLAEKETSGFSVAEHIRSFHAHAPDLRLDVLIADPGAIDDRAAVERAADECGAQLLVRTVRMNDGTARHKAQRSRVARHVRTSFVNDADNAHRHRDFFHFKPFGVRFAA